MKQISHWKNDTLLTTHILRHQPNHFLANLHLANKNGAAGQFETALPFAQTLIKDHPYRFGSWQTYTQIQRNEAAQALETLDLTLTKPTPIHTDLILARCDLLRSLKRFDEALMDLEQPFADSNIDGITFHYQTALTHFQANQILEAENSIERALTINPRIPKPRSLAEEIASKQ